MGRGESFSNDDRKVRQMRKLVPAIAAIGVIATLAGPAAADHEGIHPTFREERAYFHCVGANKVQNAEAAAPWDTTAPASVQTGAGCGVLEAEDLPGDQSSEGRFSGTFVGNIQNMTVEMWILGHSTYSAVLPADVAVTLEIDGDTYLATGEGTEMSWQESETGASRKVEFTITHLGSATEVLDADGNVVDVTTTGFATEDGDGETEHAVSLTVGHSFADEYGAWVWDASEVPAGITFNDPTPASTKLRAES